MSSFESLRARCADLLRQSRQMRGDARLQRDAAKMQRSLALRACAEAQARRGATAHDLMPLDLAAASVYRRVYEDFVTSMVQARPVSHLEALAYTIAEFTSIYVYESDGNSLRALSKEELAGALFRDGARVMCYPDGRPEVRNLAVSVKALPAVVLALQNARGPGTPEAFAATDERESQSAVQQSVTGRRYPLPHSLLRRKVAAGEAQWGVRAPIKRLSAWRAPLPGMRPSLPGGSTFPRARSSIGFKRRARYLLKYFCALWISCLPEPRSRSKKRAP
jgi:hypothetical protein